MGGSRHSFPSGTRLPGKAGPSAAPCALVSVLQELGSLRPGHAGWRLSGEPGKQHGAHRQAAWWLGLSLE